MKNLNVFRITVLCCVILSYITVVTTKYELIFNLILSFITIFMCLYSLIKNKNGTSLMNILFLFAGIFITLLAQKPNLISIPLIILLAIVIKNNESKVSMNFYIKTLLCCFTIICLLYFGLDFNKDCDTTIWRVTSNETLYRFSLGFIHANQAMLKWMVIVLAIFTLINKKNMYKLIIPLGLISFIIYEVTKSRTGLIIIIFAILLILVLKNRLDYVIPNKVKYLLAFIPLLFLLLSIISMYLEDISFLNNFFSGRFALYRDYFEMTGITLFGNQYIENHAMLDNSYLHMLLSKGLLFTGLYIIVIASLVYQSKPITILDTIILLSCFIAGLTETILFKFDLVLLIIIILFRQKEMIIEREKINEFNT